MGTPLPLLLVVLSLTAGCRFSHVKSKETVHISGRALGASGAPLADAQVRLFKEADLGEALTGIVLAIGSLGSVCLLPGAPPVCRRARVATTDSNGRYTFTLSGADTQGTLGTEATLDVVIAGKGADAPSTALSFPARSATMRLPDARLWAAGPHVNENRGMVRMTWSSLPRAAGGSAKYFAQLFDPRRQAPVWSQPASSGGGSIDGRVLEDHAAKAAATARAELSGATGTTEVRASYLSTRLPVSALSGAPLSRSKPCLAVSGTAPNLATTRQPRCAVTDGDLISSAGLHAAKGANVTGVVVDLGRPRPVGLVVARGLAGMYTIELSKDGRTYVPVTTTSTSPEAVEPAGHPVARYVRVRSPGGLAESLMTEISVW
jgi:hypothetical protein